MEELWFRIKLEPRPLLLATTPTFADNHDQFLNSPDKFFK